ncbi:MAG: T9SS type A sorting domain-containing protein [Flavobacteriales bacterium]|nr:T9SS type A sorting domain-containing protein [Flavobacteriales bacterium]
MHHTYTTLLAVVLAVSASAQQSGELDLTFSGDGIATIHFPPAGSDLGVCIAVQPDGRIVVGGSTQQQTGVGGIAMALVRLMPDGSLDNSFGTGGRVTTTLGSGSTIDDKILGIAVQADGKIIAVGQTFVNGGGYQAAILRYNSNGTLDNTFSGDGIRVDDIGTGSDDGFFDVAVQSNGSIAVVGTALNTVGYDAVVARYLTDGVPDNSFSGDGFEILDIGGVENRASGLALQVDGRMVISGEAGDTFGNSEFMLVRFTSGGALDATFGTGGVVVSALTTNADWAYDVAVQADGKIIASGIVATAAFLGDVGIARYNSDGSLDNSFSGDGWTNVVNGAYSIARSVVVLPDGRIAGGGIAGDALGVVMLLPNGSPDTNFSGDGMVDSQQGNSTYGNAVAIQPDGKLLLVGSSNFGATLDDIVVLRYHTGLVIGVNELSMALGEPLVFPNPIGSSADLTYTLQADERITVTLFDMEGRVVQVFADGIVQGAGEHRMKLDLSKDIAPGNYRIRIAATSGVSSSVQVVKE